MYEFTLWPVVCAYDIILKYVVEIFNFLFTWFDNFNSKNQSYQVDKFMWVVL